MPSQAVTQAKLRFLANSALIALSQREPSKQPGLVGADVAEPTLREMLRRALPELRAAKHDELVPHIEEALGKDNAGL